MPDYPRTMKDNIKSILVISVEVLLVSALMIFLHQELLNSDHHEFSTILPILLDIAFLAVFATFGGRLAGLFGVAPMAGKIVMGIIAGPAVLGVFDPHAYGVELSRLAGVLFILFEAGLHFDVYLLKKNIRIATLVATLGVLIPLASFYGIGTYVLSLDPISAIFLGGIFTATSVGLAVEALKRAGRLNSNLANKIIGAAVIDDILGVLVLTVLSKMSEGGLGTLGLFWLFAAVMTFFVGSYILWVFHVADRAAKYLHKNYLRAATGVYTRLFFAGLALGGALAAVLGLEPVLGAFSAGVVLSRIEHDIKSSTWERIEGYIHIFVGGFLVSIGTLLPREALLSFEAWFLAIIFTIFAFATKYVVAFLFKDRCEGRLVGTAMSIRGEVGLVFVAVAISTGVLDQTLSSAALLAVILVTVLGSIIFEKTVCKLGDRQL